MDDCSHPTHNCQEQPGLSPQELAPLRQELACLSARQSLLLPLQEEPRDWPHPTPKQLVLYFSYLSPELEVCLQEIHSSEVTSLSKNRPNPCSESQCNEFLSFSRAFHGAKCNPDRATLASHIRADDSANSARPKTSALASD